MAIQRISNNSFRLPGAVGSRILAAVFLFYLAPVMAAVALLVKLEANGPVMIRRRRCLANTGPVDLWEFRTVAAADNGANPWPDDAASALGKFLRATRLDLLPRLMNMARGELTFGVWFH